MIAWDSDEVFIGVYPERWIKRSERCPDTRRYVLVWNNLHEEIQIGEYIPDFREWRGQYGTDDNADITHWMELPERPKLTG